MGKEKTLIGLLKLADTKYSLVYEDMLQNPDIYKLSELGLKKELLRIGEDIIPKIGIATLYDNDFFDMQTEEYKSRYSELINYKTIAAIIELIEDINVLPNNKDVELKIRIYLVERK